MNITKNKFKPLLITQIYEKQNVFLISSDTINNNQQDFSNHLYSYVDTMPPESCFRIFEYKDEVHLMFYWLSNMREPRSNREGIYLIMGISCDLNTFKTNPYDLSRSFLQYLSIVTNIFNVNLDQDTTSTNVIRLLWENCELYIEKILHQWKQAIFEEESYTHKMECKYAIKRKYKIYYVLDDLTLDNYINLFTFIVSNNIIPFRTIDFSNLIGYGKYIISILNNGERIPSCIKEARINVLSVNNKNIKIIEMG